MRWSVLRALSQNPVDVPGCVLGSLRKYVLLLLALPQPHESTFDWAHIVHSIPGSIQAPPDQSRLN